MQCELFQESSVAELVSAMAAGWNAKLVVETWSRGGVIATSIGLAVAARHTGGRHVCVVPDEESRAEYVDAVRRCGQAADEMIVGQAEEAMEGLEGIDFLVVDCRRDEEFARVVRVAKLGQRGAVLICKNAGPRAASGVGWQRMLDAKSGIVRSVFLPVGEGLGVAHVAAGGSSSRGKGGSRWIKGIDLESGEEFVIRK